MYIYIYIYIYIYTWNINGPSTCFFLNKKSDASPPAVIRTPPRLLIFGFSSLAFEIQENRMK